MSNNLQLLCIWNFPIASSEYQISIRNKLHWLWASLCFLCCERRLSPLHLRLLTLNIVGAESYKWNELYPISARKSELTALDFWGYRGDVQDKVCFLHDLFRLPTRRTPPSPKIRHVRISETRLSYLSSLQTRAEICPLSRVGLLVPDGTAARGIIGLLHTPNCLL
jgi:hypothetical protein